MTACPRGPYDVPCGVLGPHAVHRWASGTAAEDSVVLWFNWPDTATNS